METTIIIIKTSDIAVLTQFFQQVVAPTPEVKKKMCKCCNNNYIPMDDLFCAMDMENLKEKITDKEMENLIAIIRKH